MTQAATLIADAKGYAATMLDAADTAMHDAVSAANSITFGWVTPGSAHLPQPPSFGLGLTAPHMSDVPFQPPNPPGAGPTFQDVASIDPSQGLPAPFSETAPNTNEPNRPSPIAEFTNMLPTLDLNVDFGYMQEIVAHPEPVMHNYTEVDRPNTSIQPFAGTVPVFDSAVPTDLDTKMSVWYHTAAPEFVTMVNGYVDAELDKLNPEFHSQMGKIEAQISKYLAGGTGLNAAVEDAIYARARGKNNAEALRVRDQSLADAATRGFTMPTGALLSATQQARQGGADNNARAASEIVVMQAEMEQKNLQFAVTTSAGLRSTMINASLAYMQNLGVINGQALDYAKSLLGSVIEMFDIQAKAYSVRVEALRAEVTAYDAYLRGIMANVELYKAELAAEQTKAQIDATKVQAYTAIIQSELAKVAVYKARVDAELGKASLQKLKVEVFQAQVQAYGAQVQAKTAEWQGYSAAWSGEVSKIAGFKAKVDAYTAKMQGYSAGISGKSAGAQAQAMTNEARAKQYAAELAGYSAGVDAAGKVSTTKLENNRQVIVAFQAEASAKIAELNSYIEYYRAVGQIGMEQAKLDTQTLISSTEHVQKQQGLIAQLHTANATVHANLAGAAMAGMNALAIESATA
jgi:hypothetical protein